MLPQGYTYVSRWVSPQEARLWLNNQGTAIPAGVGGQTGRIYVTIPGAQQPGNTGPIRIDFAMPQRGLNPAGTSEWRQVFQPVQSTPIHNLRIFVPNGTTIP